MLRSSIRLALVAAVAGAAAFAHVRLIYSVNGNPLFWDDPSGIDIVINSDGSDDLTGGSHEVAMRNSIAAWNDVTQVEVSLDEDKNSGQQARTDWQSDSLHLMWFDENNTSGFFPDGSGVVAVTPVEFFTSGRIVDADVLFNGKGFQFTTSSQIGRFDIQDVATHELGHFVGLDHSGWAGATMYPYVDPSVILHRSLSSDDIHGLRHMYPDASFASIRGYIHRTVGGQSVAGAHVVARDANGRTAGAALSRADGRFLVRGLDPGTYTLYASPLDEPVSAANLGAGHTVEVNFESTLLGSFAVTSGQTLDVGDRDVDPDVAIKLGRAGDDFPMRAIEGRTESLRVSGSGLLVGSTLSVSDPTMTVVVTGWLTNFVDFDLTVPPGAPPGHVDLTVTGPTGDRSILAAGIEITPPDPQVLSAVPSSGSVDGGIALTLSGTGFRSGARVVIGDRVYVDGANGCTVVDSTTITLTTGSTVGGLHDVVVIDPSGVEGRLPSGFLFIAQPLIDTVFPVAGTSLGGTLVTIRGGGFANGMTATIDGVPQPAVTFVDAGCVEIVTSAGVAGGPYVLQLTNPGMQTASSAFTLAPRPDPVVASIAPDDAPREGGDTVTISGSGFTAQTTVVFGASPGTGLGGTNAESVTWMDAGTLLVVTPQAGSGSTSVMVRESDTLQATVAAGAFRFTSPGGGGGGGGCGSIGPVAGPPTWREVLAGGGWALLTLLLLTWRSRRYRPARAV